MSFLIDQKSYDEMLRQKDHTLDYRVLSAWLRRITNVKLRLE